MSGPTIDGISLLTILKDDALLAAGSPFMGFVGSLSAAQGDPIKEGAAWLAFQGTLPSVVINLNTELQGQLLGVFGAKIGTALTAAQAQIASLQTQIAGGAATATAPLGAAMHAGSIAG